MKNKQKTDIKKGVQLHKNKRVGGEREKGKEKEKERRQREAEGLWWVRSEPQGTLTCP